MQFPTADNTTMRSFTDFWTALGQFLQLPTAPANEGGTRAPCAVPLEESLRFSLNHLLEPSRVYCDEETLQRYGSWPPCTDDNVQGPKVLTPAAVVFPKSEREIAQLLAWAEERELRLLPWGGGGTPYEHKQWDQTPYLVVDLQHLNRVLEINPEQRLLRIQSGMRWTTLEEHLAPHKLTTGQHFPWSTATVGGAVAAQGFSTRALRYGDLSQNLLGIKAICPAGPIRLLPARPGAPDERGLMLGTFGAWGIITEITLRLQPAPQERIALISAHASVSDALAMLERLRNAKVRFAAAEISSTRELSLFCSLTRRSIRQVVRTLLGSTPAEFQMIIDLEGPREEVNSTRRQIAELLRDKRWQTSGASPDTPLRIPDYVQQSALLRLLWEQHLLAHTLSVAVPWQIAAPFLRDWEEALQSVLLTTGGLPGQVLSTLRATDGHTMLRTLLLGFQPRNGATTAGSQIQDIEAVALTIKQRWQIEEPTAPLVHQALNKASECLDPNGVMMR